MKTYIVVVKAIITKEIEVIAENEDDAIEQAHENFSVLNDNSPENYHQETGECWEKEGD